MAMIANLPAHILAQIASTDRWDDNGQVECFDRDGNWVATVYANGVTCTREA